MWRKTALLQFLIACCVLAVAVLSSSAAEKNALLLDRTITWADGAAEHVQVGRDGYFRLDGHKVRLVGIDIGTTGLNGVYYTEANLAIIDKELGYLQAAGVRVIHVTFGYEGYKREAEHYPKLLDLLYRHKMLVFPMISGKWLPNFGNLTEPDFRIGGADSLTGWVARWCAVMAAYPNVVAVAAENELDIPVKPQAYTAAGVTAYMTLLTTSIRAALPVPVVSKLVGEVNATWPWRPEIKEAVLPFSDVPALDVYYPTVPELNSHLDAVAAWLQEKGYGADGLWITEANAGTGNGPKSADFSTAYLQSMFDHGAALVCLWVANRVKAPAMAFFDAGGNPGASLAQIARDLPKLQTPLPEAPVVP